MKIKEIFKSELFLRLILILILCINVSLVTRVKAVFDSPADLNLLSITPAELNQQFAGCNVTSLSGLAGGLVKGYSKIFTGLTFSEMACLQDQLTNQTSGDPSQVSAFLNEKVKENPNVMSFVSGISTALLEQRPVSGINYVGEKIYALQNIGSVYAQQEQEREPSYYNPGGTGYTLLRPIQSFWGWSVNVVYGFMILIIIGIAFAIMFRQKLSGGTEVRIQNAIPSIALALILVPLSYPISGLFIDFITIGSNAVHQFFLGPGAPGRFVYENRNEGERTQCPSGATGDHQCDRGYFPDDPRIDWFSIKDRVVVSEGFTAVGEMAGFDQDRLFRAIAWFLNIFAEDRTPAQWFGDVINVLFSILMIWIGVKIAWQLFKKYLVIILMPIVSPFVFAMVAIPGNSTKSIMSYLKVLGGAALFFIVAYALFLLSIIFASPYFYNSIPDVRAGFFNPPLIGNIVGLFNQTATGVNESSGVTPFLFTVISLGIYFSIPKILDGIDASLGAKNIIPEFIKTPWESFKEASSGTFRLATRTVPGLTGRAVGITRNVASGVVNLRKNFIDRRQEKAGIDQYNTASRKYKIWKNLENEYESISLALQEAQRLGRTNEAIALSNKLNDITSEAAKEKIVLSGVGKVEELETLDVNFISYIGNENNKIIWSFPLITETISNLKTKNFPGSVDLGKIVLSIKGNTTFRFSPSTKVFFTPCKTDPTGRTNVLVPDTSIKIFAADKANLAFLTQKNVGSLSIPFHLDNFKFSMRSPTYVGQDMGKSFEIPLVARFDNLTQLEDFFGKPSTVGGQSYYNQGQLQPPGTLSPTQKMFIVVDGKELKTKPFNLFLGQTY